MPLATRAVSFDITQFTGGEYPAGGAFLRITPTLNSVVDGHLVPAVAVIHTPDASGQGVANLTPSEDGTPQFAYNATVLVNMGPGTSGQYLERDFGLFSVPAGSGGLQLSDLLADGVAPADTSYWSQISEAQYNEIIAAADEIMATLGDEIHDRILSYMLGQSEDVYRRREYNGTRRSVRIYELPTFGSDVGFDDEGEGYSASLNSTAIGKSLQYISRLAKAYPTRRAALVPFIDKFAESLIGLQWNVPSMAIHGGIKVAPSDGSASVFGTAMAGLGLIEAYRVTGNGRYLAAAVRAADFCVMMHDPNDRYDELYGETPIPARTVGSVTFDGFCDRVTSADDITITSTTWNVVACEFLKEVYDETGTAAYQTVSSAALAFYQYPILNFYDVFLIENNAPSAHVNAFWNLSSRLDVADHSFRRLGGLSITSGSLATSGTVAAAAGTAVTLAASASATDDTYNGMVMDTNGGAGAGQGRIIPDYNGPTKVATIEKAFTDTIDATTTYRIGWGVNSVGTDQIEYGLATLYRMGVSTVTLKAAYDEIVSWPNTDTGDFGTAFDPGICFAGYFRVDSGLYGGAGRHFGTYYDSQGVGTMLALKHAIALADYTASLAMAEVMPDRAALLDENFDTIYTADGWATKGTIPLAVLGLGVLEVAGH